MIEAYLNTDYHVVDGDFDFVLRIGQPCADMPAPRGAAFLTAANPGGEPRSAEANRRANEALCRALAAESQLVLRGYGQSRTEDWREESFLACAIPLESAETIAREFGQNALVWIGDEGVPQLIMLVG